MKLPYIVAAVSDESNLLPHLTTLPDTVYLASISVVNAINSATVLLVTAGSSLTSLARLIVNSTVSLNSPTFTVAINLAVPFSATTNFPSTNTAAGSIAQVIVTPSPPSTAGNANS